MTDLTLKNQIFDKLSEMLIDAGLAKASDSVFADAAADAFPWTLTCASYPHPMYLSSGDSSEALVKVAEDHNRSRILVALGVK